MFDFLKPRLLCQVCEGEEITYTGKNSEHDEKIKKKKNPQNIHYIKSKNKHQLNS